MTSQIIINVNSSMTCHINGVIVVPHLWRSNGSGIFWRMNYILKRMSKTFHLRKQILCSVNVSACLLLTCDNNLSALTDSCCLRWADRSCAQLRLHTRSSWHSVSKQPIWIRRLISTSPTELSLWHIYIAVSTWARIRHRCCTVLCCSGAVTRVSECNLHPGRVHVQQALGV